MQLYIEARQKGDLISLTLLDGVSDEELLKLLRPEGVEIIIGTINAGTAKVEIRAPKRILIVVEKGKH